MHFGYFVACSIQVFLKHSFTLCQSLYVAVAGYFLPEAELSNGMAAQRLHVLRVVFFFFFFLQFQVFQIVSFYPFLAEIKPHLL